MRFLALAITVCLTGCLARSDSDTYYLYRGSIVGAERIHIATFDAREGRTYNEENCMVVRGLMERQPGVTVGYWCTQLKPSPRP